MIANTWILNSNKQYTEFLREIKQNENCYSYTETTKHKQVTN